MDDLILGIDGWGAARKVFRCFQPLVKLDTHPHFVQHIKLCAQEIGLGAEWVCAPRMLIDGEERKRVRKIIRDGIKTRSKMRKR